MQIVADDALKPVSRAIVEMDLRLQNGRLPAREIGAAGIEERTDFPLRREERELPEKRQRGDFFRAVEPQQRPRKLDGDIDRRTDADIADGPNFPAQGRNVAWIGKRAGSPAAFFIERGTSLRYIVRPYGFSQRQLSQAQDRKSVV